MDYIFISDYDMFEKEHIRFEPNIFHKKDKDQLMPQVLYIYIYILMIVW